jgi:DNA-binding FadR family transcriptional regulator
MVPGSSPQFTSLSRTRAPFEIVAQITQNIAQGTMPPGSRLPTEVELTAQFGVGRNTLREGIKILEIFGLVVIRRGEGTYIQDTCTFGMLAALFLRLIWLDPSQEELREFYLASCHALLTFADHPLQEKPGKAYEAALLNFRRQALAEPGEEDKRKAALGEYLLARDGLTEDLLLTPLLGLVRMLYGGKRIEQEIPGWAWPLLAEQFARESAAARTGAPQDIAACLLDRPKELDPFLPWLLWNRGDSGMPRAAKGRRLTASKNLIWKIVGDIIQGRFAIGDRLPTEAELMEEFQVSRNVVREAVKSLEAIGILEIRRPEGTFVAEANDAASAYIDWGAYGRILADENAARFLAFKASIRDGVFWLACQKATQEERRKFHTLSVAFAQTLLTPAPILARCTAALTELNSYLSEICGSPILRQVEQIVIQVASQSRTLFLERALETGRCREVAQSYLRDADVMLEGKLEDVTDCMRYKLRLWSSLEIASFDQPSPRRT